MLPGFPAMILGRSGPPPFNLSGSWETGDEGWVMTNSTRQNNPGVARTGDYQLASSTNGSFADYVLAAGILTGLTLRVRVWAKRFNNAWTASIQVKIGSGSFSTIASASPGLSWEQLVGSLAITSTEQITVRLAWATTGTAGYYDDWEIAGL